MAARSHLAGVRLVGELPPRGGRHERQVGARCHRDRRGHLLGARRVALQVERRSARHDRRCHGGAALALQPCRRALPVRSKDADARSPDADHRTVVREHRRMVIDVRRADDQRERRGCRVIPRRGIRIVASRDHHRDASDVHITDRIFHHPVLRADTLAAERHVHHRRQPHVAGHRYPVERRHHARVRDRAGRGPDTQRDDVGARRHAGGRAGRATGHVRSVAVEITAALGAAPDIEVADVTNPAAEFLMLRDDAAVHDHDRHAGAVGTARLVRGRQSIRLRDSAKSPRCRAVGVVRNAAARVGWHGFHVRLHACHQRMVAQLLRLRRRHRGRETHHRVLVAELHARTADRLGKHAIDHLLRHRRRGATRLRAQLHQVGGKPRVLVDHLTGHGTVGDVWRDR